MLTFKLGLLTAAFYVLLTMIAEAAIWGMVHFNGGFAIFFRGKHWFWILGAKLGFIFGILWLISFSAAWYIVYQGIKARLLASAN
jgi:hypothetical protein